MASWSSCSGPARGQASGGAGKAAPHGVHEEAKDGREVEREERKDEGKRGQGQHTAPKPCP